MSPSIWTRCAGRSELGPFAAHPWRVVEAQHIVSTRQLVDSAAEHDALEQLIDAHKPPVPPGFERLHYLLFTPFRYPPLRNGSRFGTRHERGLWYGSDQQETAFAEVAYYRLLFLAGTAAQLRPLELTLSVFQAHVATDAGVDLTRPPFAELRAQLSSPTRYDEAQALGRDMRADGVAAFRFWSARAAGDGTNVALFEPVFSKPQPDTPETWFCIVTPEQVELKPANLPRRHAIAYGRAQFEVDGRLPAPAL